MQRDCTLRIASRGRLTSFSVAYKKGNHSLFECAESFTKQELRKTYHYAVFEDNMSQFERGRIISMIEAGWSARLVARQLGRSDCVVRRRWDQWIRKMSFTRRPSSGRP
ncbi:transposable element Tcb2 transposase [Trichonephila clavipes]|nr:transposable element Tcb2 transposase [Trichonephila clavipes]